MTSHDHADFDECVDALRRVQEFLHDEMTDEDADAIRHHLHACERCMQDFDIEHMISEMVRRCQPAPKAPASLRVSITSITLRQTR